MPRKPVLLKRSATTSSAQTPAKKSTPEKKKTGKNGKSEEKENAKRNLKLAPSFGDQIVDQTNFEDETSSMASSAIESYFLQGKTASERMNGGKRRGRKAANPEAEDDEEEDVGRMIAEFAKCDLPGLRDYIASKNNDEKFEELMEKLEESQFDKWLLYLVSDFNILLHGVGSKREVVGRFIEEKLDGCCSMRVDARKEGVGMKTVLAAINENLGLKCVMKRGQSVNEWARDIRRKIRYTDVQLILIIDNIEAPDWRNEQEALCELLEDREAVKLIATVDHVYSTFIWNSRQLSTLSFVHITVNTFQIPIHELMTGESRLLGLDARSNQSTHTIQSLGAFWKSLAANSQKLFRLFFQMYFDTKRPVKFWDLFNAAKDDFIASTDAALRTQLVEFKDHRVLKWTRGDDGNDQLSGMVDSKLVGELLELNGMPLSQEE